ncbi:MAG: hypothetical protein H0S78_09625 [Tissierellales bacterium]|jgi:uridine phosphorylase|nr:hypothetical protein [Tissierellales bacterium]HCX04150.1 hypothetical protein [Clostridiales bacterium]
MEAATVLTLSSLFKIKAGAIFAVVGNRVTDEFVYGGVEKSIEAATEAAVILDKWQKLKEKNNKEYWYPSLGQ